MEVKTSMYEGEGGKSSPQYTHSHTLFTSKLLVEVDYVDCLGWEKIGRKLKAKLSSIIEEKTEWKTQARKSEAGQ